MVKIILIKSPGNSLYYFNPTISSTYKHYYKVITQVKC